MEVETIKVVADNDQGFVIINKSDKTDEQVEYKPKATRKAKPKAAASE